VRTPSIKSTRQMRTQVDTTQRRNKSKHSTPKTKTGKDPKGFQVFCAWEVGGGESPCHHLLPLLFANNNKEERLWMASITRRETSFLTFHYSLKSSGLWNHPLWTYLLNFANFSAGKWSCKLHMALFFPLSTTDHTHTEASQQYICCFKRVFPLPLSTTTTITTHDLQLQPGGTKSVCFTRNEHGRHTESITMSHSLCP